MKHLYKIEAVIETPEPLTSTQMRKITDKIDQALLNVKHLDVRGLKNHGTDVLEFEV